MKFLNLENMKKKIYTLFFGLLILLGTVKAVPPFTYTFSYSNTAYAPLVSPTVVVSNSGFNGSYYNINIGFNFNYFGTNYSGISFNTDGYCIMGTSISNYGFYTMYANLKGLGQSQISYLLDISGGAGNRILKLEWKSVGFVMDATNNDSASFQIWLYEAASKVEYHFGAWSINPSHFTSIFSNSTGVFSAFDDPSGTPYYNLQGNPVMPAFVLNPSMNLFLNGYPSNGMVYTFTPSSATGISEQSNNPAFHIYPQPAKDYINIEQSNPYEVIESYSVFNLLGESFMSENVQEGIKRIDVSALKPGMYFIRLISADKIIDVQKFIRQ
jgi:hypothetical protein